MENRRRRKRYRVVLRGPSSSPKQTREVVDICKRHDVIVGHPHANAGNMQELMDQGYRFLMSAPGRHYNDLEKGLPPRMITVA